MPASKPISRRESLHWLGALGAVGTLRRFQDDVKEVRSGVECGIKLGDYTEYEVGDIIECYELEKIAQALRKSGKRPSEQILLTLTDSEGQARYVTRYTDTEGVVRSSDNIETLDLRPLVGLSVVVCADRFGDRENRLFLRLQDYAHDVILLVAEWANQSTKEFGLSGQKGGQTQPYPEAA